MESSNDSLGIYTKLIHPLYAQGRSEAEIAKELGVDEAYIHEVIKESSQTRGDEIFHTVVRELERLVEFTHPWHSRLCALYILQDRKSTRLNSSHSQISYAVFCLKKKQN